MITIKKTMRPAEPAKPAVPERPRGFEVEMGGYDIHWDSPLDGAYCTGLHCYTPDYMHRELVSTDFRKFAELLNEIAVALEEQEKTDAPTEQ